MTTKITAANLSGVTGTGNVVLANSPTLVTPAIGTATAIAINTNTLTVSDLASFAESIEIITPLTGATGVVTHDYTASNVWIHNNIAANFTANFTNVPTTNNRVINLCLILIQGSTAYYPNAIQVDGVSQSIKWVNATTPEIAANRVELATFSLLRTSNTWTATLGSISSFG
jgi:hypothetical protein